ncbi:MAG: phosphatase PAP2 family protein [Thermodesulfobacteriota bacterium]|nr:phosphatase PAP2 family protein [Thermodesulfobacteriota bacterium]
MRTPIPARHFVLASAPLILLILFLFAALGSEHEILWFFRVHKSEHDALRRLMFLITDWANPLFYCVYALILAWALKTKDKRLIRLVITFAVVQFIVNFLLLKGVKIAVGRPRPFFEGSWQTFTLNPRCHSLPSGHTAEITGAVLPLVLWLRRSWFSVLMGCVIALVGFTRVYLCEHFPSDVAMGWMFGGLAGCAAYYLWSKKADTRHA